jgi:hypothetical protein
MPIKHLFISMRMRRSSLLILLAWNLSQVAIGQALQWSTYLNTPGADNVSGITKDNTGNIYVLGTSNSNGFPVTAGAFQSAISGFTTALTISKLSGSTGAMQWSSYLGGDNDGPVFPNGNSLPNKINWDAATNSINIIASTKSGNFPVMNGNPKVAGAFYSPVFSQFNASTGALIYSTHVFNSVPLNNTGTLQDMKVEFQDGFAFFLSMSPDFKKLLISCISISHSQFVYQKEISVTNGRFNASNGMNSLSMRISNGNVYLSGVTNAADYPTTAGAYQTSYPFAATEAYFVTKLNAAGDIAFSTFANAAPFFNNVSFSRHLATGNNEVALGGKFGNGISVTAGGLPFNNNFSTNLGILKLNATDGSLLHFTYLGSVNGGSSEALNGLAYVNNDLLVYGQRNNTYLPVTPNATQYYKSYDQQGGYTGNDLFIAHINGANQLSYCSYLGGTGTENITDVAVLDNDIYMAAVTSSIDFPLTANATQAINKGSTNQLAGELALVKYNTASKSITYSSYLGTNLIDNYSDATIQPLPGFIPKDEHLFLNTVSNASSPGTMSVDYPVTPDALQKNNTGSSRIHQYVGKINTGTGKLKYGSYLGSQLTAPSQIGDIGRALLIDGNDIYISGFTRSNDYPVTAGAVRTTYQGDNDVFLSKISLCHSSFLFDTLSPALQSVCIKGLADTIFGNVPQLGSVPLILRNGLAQSQAGNTNFTYQWQESNDNIIWANISGATGKDYQPVPITTKKYFRRISRQLFCDNTDTSSVAVVDITTTEAVLPDVGGNGQFFSCPGSGISLGTPAVAGFSYAWQPATFLSSGSTAETIFNSTNPGVYSFVLFATGPNGCTAMDTAIVFNYAANAGADKILCAGEPAQIGGSLLAGVNNIHYTWEPVAGLSCSSCPLPVASLPGTYILTATVPLPQGGNCVTTDTVKVAGANISTNPAGPDITTCNAASAVIGTPRVPGYTYNWTPAVYLSAVTDTARPVFNGPNASIDPLYNPQTYILTANNPAGCRIVDTMKVFVVDANAGTNGCRPKQLGRPDRTNGQATYQWVEMIGGIENPVQPGELSSVTIPNPVALTGTNITSSRIYRLKMTWNGLTCTSNVTVFPPCGCPEIKIKFSSSSGCPTVSGTDSVRMYVEIPNAEYSYQWSPPAGLNTTMGTSANTGIMTPIVYTVTATSIYDTSLHCSSTINVNFFNSPAPVFNAPDQTICKNSTAEIGLPPVAGLSYAWTSSISGGSVIATTSSFPITGNQNINYYAVITDNITGCQAFDTVRVTVPVIIANAGVDRPSCTNGGFTIGTPAIAGLAYSWAPVSGLDDPSLAQPSVISNISTITYTVTVTDPVSGCQASDEVVILHTENPILNPIPAPSAYCEGSGGSVQIGNPALNGVSYSWSPATNLNNAAIAQPVANPSNTTVYTVVATFPGGCASTPSQSVTVTVNPRPTVNPSVINNCNSSQLNVSSNAGSPVYFWNPATALNNSNIANPVSTTNLPITYTVFIIDQSTGCSNSNTVNVAPPVSVNAGADKQFCAGNTVQIGTAALPGVSYSWSPATGLNNNSIAQPSTLASLPAGVYTFTVSATGAGCTKTDNVVVTVTAGPDISPVQGFLICANASIQIGAAPQSTATYAWSPVSGLNDATIANPIASPAANTLYTLVAVNILNGCTSTGQTAISINTTGAPAVITRDTSICTGASVQLNATVIPNGNYAYSWTPAVNFNTSPFISNPVISPQATTTYQVQVTNTDDGCSNTALTMVTVKDTCNLVPINWLSFTAGLKDGNTLLEWKVGMEENNSLFIAERSNDGYRWIPVFTVPSLGNTQEPRTYSGTDPSPLTGINYYRIRQVDLDGHYSYSVVRSVQVEIEKLKCLIYPNPASYLLNYRIQHTGNFQGATMLIYTMEGRLVKTVRLNKPMGVIPIPEQAPGIYLVSFSDHNGWMENSKLVVQK